VVFADGCELQARRVGSDAAERERRRWPGQSVS
jgi:hypothetical protein